MSDYKNLFPTSNILERKDNHDLDCEHLKNYLIITITLLLLLSFILLGLTVNRLKYYCCCEKKKEMIDAEVPSCTILKEND